MSLLNAFGRSKVYMSLARWRKTIKGAGLLSLSIKSWLIRSLKYKRYFRAMKYPMKNRWSTVSRKICSVLGQNRQVRYLVNSLSRYMRSWGHFTLESKTSCCWKYNTQREISRLRMWSSFSDFRSMCKIGYLYQVKQQATICNGRAACMKSKSQASLRSRARNQRCCLSTKTAKTHNSARAT